jgi:hypothetical protein
MYRLVWFVAGAVVSYIASGYVEGLLEEDEDNTNEHNKTAEGV